MMDKRQPRRIPLVTNYQDPRAPATSNPQQSYSHIAQSARHVPGWVPSSNARARTTCRVMKIETLDAINAHPCHGPALQAAELHQHMCQHRNIHGALRLPEAKRIGVQPRLLPPDGVEKAIPATARTPWTVR